MNDATLRTPRFAFEDFHVGQVIPGGELDVTADEIVAFASRYDPQPFHVDADAARTSIYGGLIASGWHTSAMVMRMACDAYLTDSTSAGSPGVDQIRWIRPIRAGDTIRAEFVVVEVRASTSKPDRGVVATEWRVYDGRGELAMTLRGMGLFMRRAS